MRFPALRGEPRSCFGVPPRLTDANSPRIHRLSTALQILIFLPLTLSTLSKSAFLLLSLLLFLHSLIHGTLVFFWGSPALSIMQVPMHPFLLLVCFNVFSETVPPWLMIASTWWGKLLHWSGPGFIVMEGMSSLIVAQRLGQVGKELVGEGEVYQFGLLVGAAAAYVASAWWIVVVSFIILIRSMGIILNARSPTLQQLLLRFPPPSLVLR